MNTNKPCFVPWRRWDRYPECPACGSTGTFYMLRRDTAWFWVFCVFTFPLWLFVPIIPFGLVVFKLVSDCYYDGCKCAKCGQHINFEYSTGHY